jgi:hypothetical protein
MQLEIVIKVPLGVAAVSEEQAAGAHRSNGRGAVADESGEVAVHEPPPLAELGIAPVESPIEAPPPSIMMLERLGVAADAPSSPPGLEDVPLPDDYGMGGASAAPPDLPDLSEIPSVMDEFAPPAIDNLKPDRNEASSRKSKRKS